jgi:PhzF family phenazine biosynthesis protein
MSRQRPDKWPNLWIVDAFTPVAFRGNAAAVCLMDGFPDAEVMQTIALQMYLSETAFVVKTAPLAYNLRWFTPEAEVNLCGHATLAATHVLHQSGQIKAGDTVRYNTLSGELKARVLDRGIELDFPTLPGKPIKTPASLKALGVDVVNCEINRDNYLVEVKDMDTLLSCAPNFKRLARMEQQGVIVTTATGVEGFDFASRYFCPGLGIDEDPVTGSAHCFLAPYWAQRLGKQSFHALQASKGHGILDVTLAGERTLIAGECVTTLKGQIPAVTSRNKQKEAAC